MNRMNESARAMLAAASIFLTGAVAGVGMDRLVLIPTHARVADATALHTMPRDHDAVLDELARDLGLTPVQSDSVRSILDRHQAEINRAWAEVRQALESTIGLATTEVESVLDAEQIVRLHVWLQERHGPIPGHAVGERH